MGGATPLQLQPQRQQQEGQSTAEPQQIGAAKDLDKQEREAGAGRQADPSRLTGRFLVSKRLSGRCVDG